MTSPAASPGPSPDPAASPAPPARRRALAVLGVLVLVAGAAWVGYDRLVGSRHESTDNAYVQAPVVQITPQVGGTVLAAMRSSGWADSTRALRGAQFSAADRPARLERQADAPRMKRGFYTIMAAQFFTKVAVEVLQRIVYSKLAKSGLKIYVSKQRIHRIPFLLYPVEISNALF